MSSENHVPSAPEPAPGRFGGQRWTLILLILLCVTPLVAVWVLLQIPSVLPLGAASHGELIQPPRPLQNLMLQDPTAAPGQAAPRLHGRWSLVYLNQGQCLAPCREQLERMKRIRLAQGRHYPRVQRVLHIDQQTPDPALRELLSRYPGQLLWLCCTPPALAAFHLPGQAGPWHSGRLFLVDPLGNLMMSYAADAEPGGIIKDLGRLLRASRIG